MKRTIYHGSEFIIQKPEFGKGKLYNDYGRGFYCTEDADLAREWSVQRDRDGILNVYSIDDSELNVLNLQQSPEFTSLHWIELLMSNRVFEQSTPLAIEATAYLHQYFHVDISKADIIVGYRADDSYFSYAQDFIDGGISCGQLSQALMLGRLGLQYVLKSSKAFDSIVYEGSEEVSSKIWYPKKEIRDLNARRDYHNMSMKGYVRGELYMLHILDGEVKPGDLRIR